MIISCPDCGSSISKASQFCPKCGSPTAFTLAMKAVRKLCKRWLLYSLGISLGGSVLISLDWMGLHFAHTSILGLAVLVTGLAGLLWLANTMPKR